MQRKTLLSALWHRSMLPCSLLYFKADAAPTTWPLQFRAIATAPWSEVDVKKRCSAYKPPCDLHKKSSCLYTVTCDSARVQGYWECYIDTGSLRRTWRRKQVRRAATLVMRLMTKQSTKIRNSSSFINFNTVFFRIGRSSVLFTLHRGLDLPIRTVIKQTGKMWT